MKNPIYYSDMIEEAIRTFPKGTPRTDLPEWVKTAADEADFYELERIQREARRAKWAADAAAWWYGEV